MKFFVTTLKNITGKLNGSSKVKHTKKYGYMLDEGAANPTAVTA